MPLRHCSGNHLVYVDLKLDQTVELEALSWLDRIELQRWERYQVEQSKREFALCRATLRQLLCQHLGCENSHLSIIKGDHGKPYAVVEGEQVSTQFSVSHSDPHGLIMIAESARVGIDVETPKPERDYNGIAKMIFSPSEYAEIRSFSGQEKTNLFYRIWTFKEALVKAIGDGLSTNLSQFEIPSSFRRGSRKGVIEYPESSGTRWIFEDLSTTEYVAASVLEVL